MTLATIKTLVRNQLNQPSTSPWLSDADLLGVINSVQNTIAVKTECLLLAETVATVSSQAEYALPSAWYKTRVVQHINGTVYTYLTAISYDDYLNITNVTDSTKPTHYAVNVPDKKLVLWRTPSAVQSYKHLYIALPADMSSDSDVPFDSDARLYMLHDLIAYMTIDMIKAREPGAAMLPILDAYDDKFERVKHQLSSTVVPATATYKRSKGTLGKPAYPVLPAGY